jgi:UDP:flavonoid glycosyltransferase YjiC (YdhE family)
MADQPYWGRRIHELGVGPEPIPHRELDVDSLADRILSMVQDEEIRTAAAALGELIRAENGAERAAELVTCHVQPGDGYQRSPKGFWSAVSQFWDRPKRIEAQSA